MRTFRSSTNTTTRRVTVADRTGWTTCNWYTGGVIMGTTRGSGVRRPRLEPDDEQSSRPVLRGLGSGNGARLPDTRQRPSPSEARAVLALNHNRELVGSPECCI